MNSVQPSLCYDAFARVSPNLAQDDMEGKPKHKIRPCRLKLNVKFFPTETWSSMAGRHRFFLHVSLSIKGWISARPLQKRPKFRRVSKGDRLPVKILTVPNVICHITTYPLFLPTTYIGSIWFGTKGKQDANTIYPWGRRV